MQRAGEGRKKERRRQRNVKGSRRQVNFRSRTANLRSAAAFSDTSKKVSANPLYSSRACVKITSTFKREPSDVRRKGVANGQQRQRDECTGGAVIGPHGIETSVGRELFLPPWLRTRLLALRDVRLVGSKGRRVLIADSVSSTCDSILAPAASFKPGCTAEARVRRSAGLCMRGEGQGHEAGKGRGR